MCQVAFQIKKYLQIFMRNLHAGPSLAIDLYKNTRRPISRVLSSSLTSEAANNLGWPFIWDVRYRTPRATDPGSGSKTYLPAYSANSSRVDTDMPPLLGLAPGGVCRAADVAAGAVRSYHTLSPLPDHNVVRWFAFCGTFPRVTPAGCYPAPCFRGARTFLPCCGCPQQEQPSDRLANKIYALTGRHSINRRRPVASAVVSSSAIPVI